jgi:hypothetical protein
MLQVKEQVGDLLDHLERVRDTAGPERVPDAVDLIPDVASDHALGFTLGLEGNADRSSRVLYRRRYSNVNSKINFHQTPVASRVLGSSPRIFARQRSGVIR